MRLLKLATISLMVFFLLLTAIGLLIPSTVKVSRAIDINAPVDSVYVLIDDINNWSKWMSGLNDACLQTLKINADGNVVKSKTATHELVILKATKDSVFTLWKAGNGEVQQSNFLLFKNTNISGTTINWQFLQHAQWYPWARLGSIMNEKILGPEMEKSLEHLKEIAEQ